MKDNSYIDVHWGLSFVYPLIAIINKRCFWSGPYPDQRAWLVLALVTVWALRLSFHILVRHKEEDFRY